MNRYTKILKRNREWSSGDKCPICGKHFSDSHECPHSIQDVRDRMDADLAKASVDDAIEAGKLAYRGPASRTAEEERADLTEWLRSEIRLLDKVEKETAPNRPDFVGYRRAFAKDVLARVAKGVHEGFAMGKRKAVLTTEDIRRAAAELEKYAIKPDAHGRIALPSDPPNASISRELLTEVLANYGALTERFTRAITNVGGSPEDWDCAETGAEHVKALGEILNDALTKTT